MQTTERPSLFQNNKKKIKYLKVFNNGFGVSNIWRVDSKGKVMTIWYPNTLKKNNSEILLHSIYFIYMDRQTGLNIQ